MEIRTRKTPYHTPTLKGIYPPEPLFLSVTMVFEPKIRNPAPDPEKTPSNVRSQIQPPLDNQAF
jgi:hypothetical protein